MNMIFGTDNSTDAAHRPGCFFGAAESCRAIDGVLGHVVNGFLLRPYASVLLVVFVFASTGCVYPRRYVDDLTRGNHVVVTLTDEGIPDMAPRLGQGVFLVKGEVQSVGDSALTLAVWRTESTTGVLSGDRPTAVPRGGDVVAIPRADIATVRRRQVSAPGVIIAATAIAGATIAAIAISAHAHPDKLPPSRPAASPATP
jgi:hypothetical protein